MNSNNISHIKNVAFHDYSFDDYYRVYYRAGLWPLRTVIMPHGNGIGEIVPYDTFAMRYKEFRGPAPQDIIDATTNGKLGRDGISLVMHDGLFAIMFNNAEASERYEEMIEQKTLYPYLDTLTIVSPHSKRYVYNVTERTVTSVIPFAPGVDIIGDGAALRTEPTVHPEGGHYSVTNTKLPLEVTSKGVDFLFRNILEGIVDRGMSTISANSPAFQGFSI